MATNQSKPLGYLEWVALVTLYQQRHRVSSPVRYVGLPTTVKSLIEHQPPLAEWIGNHSNNQVHITPEGVATYEKDSSGD